MGLIVDHLVSLLPTYQALEPFILAVWSTVILPALLAWVVAQFQTRTNIHVSDQARAAIQQAATNAAGRILAGQEGNIATMKFDVHSPLVAAEVTKVQAAVPGALGQLGITPAATADLIAGKIGLLQASAAASGQKVP